MTRSILHNLEYTTDGKSTLICEVDDEGNLYLISQKIIFPSKLEQWDEKWDNDFHIAKISHKDMFYRTSVRI